MRDLEEHTTQHTTEFLLHESVRLQGLLDRILKTKANKDVLTKVLEIEHELTLREGE